MEIAQAFGDQFIDLQPIITEQDGGFSAEISQVPTTVVVRADGYYSARRTVSMGSSYDLGEIALTKPSVIASSLLWPRLMRSGVEKHLRNGICPMPPD